MPSLPTFLMVLAVWCLVAFSALEAQAHAEREPNGSPGTATSVMFGDSAIAALSSVADSDFFAVDVAAGTVLRLHSSDWQYFHVHVFDADGRTLIGSFGGDTPYENQSHRYAVTRAGRYYIAVYPRDDHEWITPPNYPYWVTVNGNSLSLGPADPAAPFAYGSPMLSPMLNGYQVASLAAAASGDLHGLTLFDSLFRISPSGEFEIVAIHPRLHDGSIAVDGFGSILLWGQESTGREVLWRFTQSGGRTRFAEGPAPTSDSRAVTIGPDGDVWTVSRILGGRQLIWRFDPFGVRKDSIDVTAALDPRNIGYGFAEAIAFSPDGVLHVMTNDRIFQLVGRTLQVALSARRSQNFRAMAYDADGRLYAAISDYAPDAFDRVVAFGPDYQLVVDPLATVNTAALTFGRSASGAMTNRLFVTRLSRVDSLNPEGIPAKGFQIGVDFLAVIRAGDSTGAVGLPFHTTLDMPAAPEGVTWSIVTGALPPGVTLNGTTGDLRGVPTDTGSFSFTIQARAGTRFGYVRPTVVVAPGLFTESDVVTALLGGDSISPAAAAWLDDHGNRNGRLDVGDLRAYLKAIGRVP